MTFSFFYLMDQLDMAHFNQFYLSLNNLPLDCLTYTGGSRPRELCDVSNTELYEGSPKV